MKIVFGADHGGFELKETLKKHCLDSGYQIEDLGTHSTDSCDYPLIADKVAAALANGAADFGILVCGTGIGISIAANRHKGIRAALLYNDAVAEGRLASFLTEWMKRNAVNEVIAPNDSALAAAARNAGIKVEAEGFAERRYIWDPRTRQLALMPRRYPEASIKNLKEAVEQSVRMVRSGEVTAFVETGGEWIERLCPIVVETVCIHSDSVIAVDLAELLRKC